MNQYEPNSFPRCIITPLMNICIFGDSITWGPRLPFRVAWANLLRNHLEKSSDNLYSLYDLGIDGNTSTDVIERFELEAKSRKPEIIIFNIGVNDSLFRETEDHPETPLELFETNVQTLIDMARKFTDKILVVGLVKGSEMLTTPLIQSTTKKSYTKSRVKMYDTTLKEVTLRNNLVFVDVNEKLNDDDFDDGLHPNINGHIKIFERVSTELDKILNIKHERYAILVDKEDREIGYKKLDVLDESDIIRVAGLWITNSNGEVLLSKRPTSKRREPNRWSPSVACIVEKGSSYLSAMKLAAKNEIGLEDFVAKEDSKLLITGEYQFYCQMFSCQIDLDLEKLDLNKNETQEIKWFTVDEIDQMLKENPHQFVQSFEKYFSLYK